MPASKPAFDAALDSGNSLTTGIEFASWFAEDEDNPARLTDVSGNALHGTLTGLDPDYEMVVTGGTGGNAVYNQTYSPAGSEGGKTKYVSADTNYKLSYYYEMDPEMDGAWYLWAASASVPYMDGYVSTKTGNVAANGGSYTNSFAVAAGATPISAFDATGLQTRAGGYVAVTADSNLEPGTADFSIVIYYTYNNPVQEGAPDTLVDWGTESGTRICVKRWAGDGGWADPKLNILINDGTSTVGGNFASSGSAWPSNTPVIVGVSCDRSGYARLCVNGTYVSQLSISSAYRTLSSIATLRLGKDLGSGTSWSFIGKLHTVLIYPGRLLSDAEQASIAADIYDLAASGTPATGRPMQLFQQVRESRSAQSVRVRNF